ncbi:MAG: 50S ribosomal protein L25 [Elusimicrobia bacterium]|nr:50S ribosomal protein L25 [Elusimicrobiota bacterium]
MAEFDLDAEIRATQKRSDLNNSRRVKRIPGIIYGADKPNVNIWVIEKAVKQILQAGGGNAIFRLKHSQGTETVILKTTQHHVVTDASLHMDFQRISLKEKIEFRVPVVIIGSAAGIQKGGTMEHLLREISVRCLPTSIPEKFEVDVSALEIGDGLRVKAIRFPADIEVLEDLEKVVVNVIAPKVEETPAAPAAGAEAAAEPEVIAKGKKPEEGAAETPAEGGKPAAKPAGKPSGKPA